MDSETSSLSSAPPSGDEKLAPIFLKAKAQGAPKKRTSIPKVVLPPVPARTPSPELEETFSDHPDIAFIVMFRNRFSDAFPAKLAHLGPQDIERGVSDEYPSPLVEDLLCALLGIVLNRKKPVERGHHGRAMEEALGSQKSQWPRAWKGVNPLHGSNTFTTLNPTQRLDLLRQLIIWSLTTSDQVSMIIKESYKQTRHDDDQNQPLSVQPWGKDIDKRAYFLIEGQDDTTFRLYREADRTTTPKWRNMAGTIDEIKAMATKLEKDQSISARQMAKSIFRTIPRFEATEEKRRRREYRQLQRSRFTRPEPGFSLYEGRTRGKRMRYTFDDDEDEFEELPPETRRSGRQSDRSTPAEPAGPVVTASGRQVKARGGGLYGESLLVGANTAEHTDFDMEDAPRTRSSRSSVGSKRTRVDGDEDMSDRESESDGGWNSADNANGDDDHTMDQDDEDLDDDIQDVPGHTNSIAKPENVEPAASNAHEEHPILTNPAVPGSFGHTNGTDHHELGKHAIAEDITPIPSVVTAGTSPHDLAAHNGTSEQTHVTALASASVA